MFLKPNWYNLLKHFITEDNFNYCELDKKFCLNNRKGNIIKIGNLNSSEITLHDTIKIKICQCNLKKLYNHVSFLRQHFITLKYLE